MNPTYVPTFLSCDGLLPWWRIYGAPRGGQLMVVALREDSGALPVHQELREAEFERAQRPSPVTSGAGCTTTRIRPNRIWAAPVKDVTP